ncbi:hypothetical protein PINS_up016573 [Pythium insidiosum]|nr:hypothetical protein PINS_up016573 [Pythium insidiosum]
MSAIRNQQAQLLRQSERRLKAAKTKSSSSGKRPTSGSIDSPTPSRVGGSSTSNNNNSGHRRAEQRRQARIARRRGSLSPAMKVASRDRDESVPLPMLPLDSDDDEVVDISQEAHEGGDNQSLESRLRRVTLHSTSWSALRLRATAEPPRNVLEYGAVEDLPAPFSRSMDLPLEAYDDDDAERPISRLASVLMPSQLRSTHRLNGDSTTSKRELEQQVDDVLSTVEPRLKACHERRVRHIVEATRRQIASYRAQIRALRSQALDMGGEKLD